MKEGFITYIGKFLLMLCSLSFSSQALGTPCTSDLTKHTAVLTRAGIVDLNGPTYIFADKKNRQVEIHSAKKTGNLRIVLPKNYEMKNMVACKSRDKNAMGILGTVKGYIILLYMKANSDKSIDTKVVFVSDRKLFKSMLKNSEEYVTESSISNNEDAGGMRIEDRAKFKLIKTIGN